MIISFHILSSSSHIHGHAIWCYCAHCELMAVRSVHVSGPLFAKVYKPRTFLALKSPVVILCTTSFSIQQFNVPSTLRVYVLCVVVRLSKQLVSLKEENCSLWGTNWIFIRRIDCFRGTRVIWYVYESECAVGYRLLQSAADNTNNYVRRHRNTNRWKYVLCSYVSYTACCCAGMSVTPPAAV